MISTSDSATNYYTLLEVDPGADRQTLKQAYLAKIKEWHPDKNPDCVAEAEEKTKTLNLAYDILQDPEQRKNYDRMLRYTKGKDFNVTMVEMNDRPIMITGVPASIAVEEEEGMIEDQGTDETVEDIDIIIPLVLLNVILRRTL